MKIGIIDYGMGNLYSVKNALKYLNYNSVVTNNVEELKTCDKYILPGVGAFKDAMFNLEKKSLDKFIKEIISKDIHLLGICLGMQLLFECSTEHGLTKGLGILKGNIIKMNVSEKIPHMGWNSLNIKKKSPLYNGLEEKPYVYFVHSYHLQTKDDIVSATVNYGKEIQVSAQQQNVFALQYHPEKSGDTGLCILKNFVML